MPSDLERLRARLVHEASTSEEMGAEAARAGDAALMHECDGQTFGLTVAISHIDIMLSVIAEEQSEPTEN